MPFVNLDLPARQSCLLAVGIAIVLICPATYSQNSTLKRAEQSLVHVNIMTEMLGAPESVVVAGRVIPNYQPKIVELFPSTGIVIDDKGHVLTFLGYRWVDIHARDTRIEIVDSQGRKHPGKLIGIDQSVRVAVVQGPGGTLKRTALCDRCDVKAGATVVIPVLDGSRVAQFESAPLMAVSSAGSHSGWAIQINRPVSVVGAPLFNSQNQVIGLVADQPSKEAGPNLRFDITILTSSQMLNSANRIIKAGGDIPTGWLGVMTASESESRSGVIISNVEEDSPAFRAGLQAGDVMTKWNGTSIRDELKLIEMVQNTPIGSEAVIDILRDGRPLTVRAVIGVRKAQRPVIGQVIDVQNVISLPGVQAAGSDVPSQTTLGIDLVPLTPELADFLQMPYQPGLYVASVNKQTPFDRAGVATGDVILELDGLKLTSSQKFFDHIRSRGWGSSIILRLLRKGVELSKTVELPKLPGGSKGK